MNEIFDKLALRFLFTITILLSILGYRYLHRLIYPSLNRQLFQKFLPSRNEADTLHLFSRILGLGIIYSEFYFQMENGFSYALLDFFIRALFAFVIYLASLFIIESIALYNFEYSGEVLKRKNISYSMVCFAQAVGISFILKTVLKVSIDSFVMLIFLWLFSMVLIGFASKAFNYVLKVNFNPLLIQKSIPLGVSYLGFFLGSSVIVASTIDNQLIDIKWYTIQVILKIILSLMILPIILWGLKYLFQIEEPKAQRDEDNQEVIDIDLGQGIYKGVLFFTSCFITTVITNNVNFGSFYPVF